MIVPLIDELVALASMLAVGIVCGLITLGLVCVVAVGLIDHAAGVWLYWLRWPLTALGFLGGIVWAVMAA